MRQIAVDQLLAEHTPALRNFLGARSRDDDLTPDLLQEVAAQLVAAMLAERQRARVPVSHRGQRLARSSAARAGPPPRRGRNGVRADSRRYRDARVRRDALRSH